MQIDFYFLKQIPLLNPYPEVGCRLYGHHLKNRPITTQFDRQMENDTSVAIHRSISKPEIEQQYGGGSFSETGSSFISAVN